MADANSPDLSQPRLPNSPNIPGYIMDKDMADSLKLEMGSLSPVEQKTAKEWAGTITSLIFDSYGKYIPEDKISELQNIPNRVIVTDENTLKEFFDNWPSDKTSNVDVGSGTNLQGLTEKEGQPILIRYNPDITWSFLDSDTHEGLIRMAGGENSAKRLVAQIYLVKALTHEILHQFNFNNYFDSFNRSLLEAATSYYEEDITAKIGYDLFSGLEKKIQARNYRELLSMYGEGLHLVYFGGVKVKP